jgi:hypothetical protein
MMRRRGGLTASTALAASAFVLAQLIGCGSCVKDEDAAPATGATGRSRPVNPAALNKEVSRYEFADSGAPPAAEADAGAK